MGAAGRPGWEFGVKTQKPGQCYFSRIVPDFASPRLSLLHNGFAVNANVAIHTLSRNDALRVVAIDRNSGGAVL